MRIRVTHETTYHYERPAKSVIQTLRLTPRSHDGQHVARWRIDIDQDVRLTETEDAFGNVTHAFSAAGSIETMNVRVEGEVETHDRAGVLYGVIERFPTTLYLRENDVTQADEAIRSFAQNVVAGEANLLSTCHALMDAIHDHVAVNRDPKQEPSGLKTAFARREGTCQDLTHIFISAARELKIPARYVSGLLYQPEADVANANANHAWAEAFVEDYGWIGFDPSFQLCPNVNHIRVATGLDNLGAAPVRSAHYGGDGESLDVRFDIREKLVRHQAQSQSQS